VTGKRGGAAKDKAPRPIGAVFAPTLRRDKDGGVIARRLLGGFLGLAVGYPAAAALGYCAILLFSDNRFDRSLEAAMTAAFAIGPIGALFGLILGIVLGGRRAKADRPPTG
jgi:hypothetical protein